MSGSQSAVQQAQAQNAQARSLIQAYGLEMCQQVYSAVVVPSSQNTINIAPRNVGLIRGFWIEVGARMSVASGTANLTDFGPANLLQQVAFYDLNNNLRINTAGWHVAFLDAIRKGYIFPGTWTPNTVIKYGSTFMARGYAAPSTLPTSVPSTPNVSMLYYVPISYTKDDLRGAIYAGVTNATMNLQLTLNYPNWNVASGDSTLAVYSGGTTPTWTDVTVTVYQDYIDQIPSGPGGVPVLPILDMSTVYELKNTSFTGITANQDFPMPYANFRQFLSTFCIYDNNGTRNSGSDVSYFALQSANYTNILKADPFLWSQWTRDMLESDFPPGVYYLDTRRRPLNTNQYGNLQLLLNASSATSALTYVAYEDFAMINQVQLAGSLAGS